MPISDDQIALLETVRAALQGLQDSAAGVGVLVQTVTVVFPTPEGENPRNVTFGWSQSRSQFDIRS